MVINDLQEIKTIIANSIELCRLHDYMSEYNADSNVKDVVTKTGFNVERAVWYTTINSLYSSVSMVYQYMKNQGADVNTLDDTFSYTSWHITECYEHDDSGNRNSPNPDLNIILNRLRNAVSHGLYEVDKSSGYAPDYELIFRDQNSRKSASNTRKNFYFKINGMKLDDFLMKIENGFNAMYP